MKTLFFVIITFITAFACYSPTASAQTHNQQIQVKPTMTFPQGVLSSHIDIAKYSRSPFNLPTPKGAPSSDFNYGEKQKANLNRLGSHVTKHQTYLQQKVGATLADPFLAVIWNGAIENVGGNRFFFNCQDAVYQINSGCPGGFYSGGWQVGWGIQVSQAIAHLAEDFEAVYGSGSANNASKVQEVGQKVINDSASYEKGKITNPSSFPATTIGSLVSGARGGNTSAQQAVAVLLMDEELGAIVVQREIAGDIQGNNNWAGTMSRWSSYYSSRMQEFSNRMKVLADGYTGEGGQTSPGTTGIPGSTFGNIPGLTLIVRPKTPDSWVVNQAQAEVIGARTPTGNYPPAVPVPAGQYAFPLNPSTVTGIASEMAAYANGYAFGGHREHAGLDIGTPEGQRVPVYVIADGTVSAARESCYVVSQGATCRIDVNHGSIISSYTHVNVNASIRLGTRVRKGQQIAVVHFWGPGQNMDHLHFELQSANQKDALGVPVNINPRNYLPELQRWKPDPYGGTGQAVRRYTDSVGLFWASDGKEFAETYRNHPPCTSNPGGCWAH
jgi:murein DD-endopeptidase MepM/ murein hydrolase activator NlpD